MDYITSGTRRMRQLVDGLLQLSRVGTHTWAPEAVDSDALVVEVESLLHSSMAESGAEVVRQDLPVVHGDPRLLTQLFQNLLANALKFRGRAAPRVCVSCEDDDDGWLFAVRDNGIGFESDHAEQIFEFLERLHSTGTYDGAGIGLPICRRIAEAHGGQIRAESSPGEGATFRFTLPKGPER